MKYGNMSPPIYALTSYEILPKGKGKSLKNTLSTSGTRVIIRRPLLSKQMEFLTTHYSTPI